VINQLPKEIPEQPEHWREVLKDLENIILPGLTHWQSPYFNAFYPSSSSAGSIIGELLIAGIGVLGFSWVSGKYLVGNICVCSLLYTFELMHKVN